VELTQIRFYSCEKLSDKQKEAFAWKWWISDLQRGTESMDKFVKFIPRQKYCQSDGFVPGQYLQLMDGQEGSFFLLSSETTW
jgi:hypothetical protein